MGNEGEGKVKDDSPVSRLSERAEEGPFTEISTTARGVLGGMLLSVRSLWETPGRNVHSQHRVPGRTGGW